MGNQYKWFSFRDDVTLTRSRDDTQPERVSRRSVGVEDDIVTLTNTKDEVCGIVRD